MTKLIRSFTLSVLMMLVLASCGFFGTTAATEAPLQILQPTQALAPAAVIELVVQADTSVPFTAVGQVIKYNFNIKNIGTAPAAGPVIVTGAAVTCPELITIGNLNASLDGGEALPCTSNYTIIQADLDKGSVTSITTATLSGINSNAVTTTVPVSLPKILALTVTANPTNYNQASQIITFTYVVKNGGTGNLGPSQFTVNGGYLGATPLNCGDAAASLAPGATVTCTSTYTTTQNDLAADNLTHQVTASGGGAGPSPAASATITKGNVNQPSLAGCTPANCKEHTVIEGEWLWQIARCYGVNPNTLAADNKATIPNPSQITAGTKLIVSNPGSYSKLYGPPCITFVNHTLQTGDTWISLGQKYSADSTVLQMANPNTTLSPIGSVIKLRIPNYSAGTVVTAPPTQAKALTLTVAVNPPTYDQVGQILTFTYVVKNSGTANLGPSQFTVSGGYLGATPLNCGDAAASLAPGATVTCTSTYTIVQNDLALDSLAHQVTASGGGAGPSQPASVTISKAAKLLTLTVAVNPVTYNAAGQLITYTYVIKNSGSVNLGPGQFTVNGGFLGATPLNCGDAAASLAANATVTCTSQYTITQADLAANNLTNQVTAAGGGAAPSQPASVTITKE